MATILKNGNEQHELTKEDMSKGGKKSGEVRKEKATLRKALEMLLDETNKKGVSYRDLTTLGLIKGAIDGKAENYKVIAQMLGELDQKEQIETPVVNINVVDNTELEKALYEDSNSL